MVAVTGCPSSEVPCSDCGPAALDKAKPAIQTRAEPGPEEAFLREIGLPAELAVGVGNDLIDDTTAAHAWQLEPKPSIHYLYLVGLPGRGGWPDWNKEGSFVSLHADAARKQGVVPMFTLYAMATSGEGNLSVLTDPSYMNAWWEGYALLLDRLAVYDGPALVHVEPDFWGFAQQRTNAEPNQIAVSVSPHIEECAADPDTLVGMVRCLTRMARKHAPKVRLGLHASIWAAPEPAAVASWLKQLGVESTDVLFVETLDRDAGCFEVGGDGCQRSDGPWYWDESNQSSPNFTEHLVAMSVLRRETGLPLIWWQMPLGVSKTSPGGSEGAYRDNRVQYFFGHPEEFAHAGGAAVLFGAGWTGQTTLQSDGGQFQRAWGPYSAKPVSVGLLPEKNPQKR